MQPSLAVTSKRTVHQRYRWFLRAGFTPQQSASLSSLSDGMDRDDDNASPAPNAWRWEELSRIEFIGYLARSGRIGGPADGRP